MFVDWQKRGLLQAYVPEDVAKNIAPDYRDPDGQYAMVRSTLCIIAYNTGLVKREDAPTSLNGLLDPKWVGKLVKANPSYSGTIITSTYQLVRNLGWPYLEKLAKQKVMQVQSATDTPKRSSWASARSWRTATNTTSSSPRRTASRSNRSMPPRGRRSS